MSIPVQSRVYINDTSSNHFGYEGTVVGSPNSNGYQLVHIDGVGHRNYDSLVLQVIDPVETVKAAPNKEYEKIVEQSFVVVVNDEEMTDFGDDELKAAHFAIRALRLGDSAHVFERKVTESYRLVDPA